MILFAIFVWLAIAQRRNPQSHKRWMLLATVNLVTAAIARAAGCIQSRYGEGLLIVVSQPLRLVVSSTQGWLVFRSVGDRATRLIASSTQRTS
jgi:type II secretory pathway component PulJ